MILYVNGIPVDQFPKDIQRTQRTIQQWIIGKVQTQDFTLSGTSVSDATSSSSRYQQRTRGRGGETEDTDGDDSAVADEKDDAVQKAVARYFGIPYNWKKHYMRYVDAYPRPKGTN